jgi:hypothetical protein
VQPDFMNSANVCFRPIADIRMTEKTASMINRSRRQRISPILAGCLWLASALLLLPAIWVGHIYDYGVAEWLSLVRFPGDPAENGVWLFRIGLLLVLLGSTAWLVVHFIKRRTRPKG